MFQPKICIYVGSVYNLGKVTGRGKWKTLHSKLDDMRIITPPHKNLLALETAAL